MRKRTRRKRHAVIAVCIDGLDMLIIAIAIRHADLHADFAMVRSTSDGRDGRIVELVAKWRFSLISCKACLRVARRAERSAMQSDNVKNTGIRASLT